MEHPGRMLVISDGGVGSLVACMAAREAMYAGASAAAGIKTGSPAPPASVNAPGAAKATMKDLRPLIMLGELPAQSGTARRKAVERQCAALDLELIDATPADTPPEDVPAGERATRLLLSAAFAALRHGVPRVVWPIHCFDGEDIDLDGVSDAVDRALLVTRLASLDARPGVRVEAPYADFADRQIAELALDLEAPVRTCWWWHAQAATPDASGATPTDEFRAEYKRWTAVLREVGWVQESGVG